jgi:hypothetical protein
MPFPILETTPPVTNTNFVIQASTVSPAHPTYCAIVPQGMELFGV